MSNMIKIQAELHAPKSQYNKFGKYNYRNSEDIIEAVKPVLAKYDCWLNISDEMILIGDRYYLCATASVKNDAGVVESSCGFAREAFEQKGMQEAQITGSSSSYARKYALNGLFAIDDTKDADSVDNTKYEQINPEPINMKNVQGVFDMYIEELEADKDEPDYARMQAGDARLTNDERIAVMDKLKALGKFPETNRAYTTIVNQCLKEEIA